MREIKFDVMVQIKHPEVGEVAFEHNPISEYLHDGFIFFKNGILSTDQEDDDHKTIIREYTGLKDSFDHEVYEGDIVKHNIWGNVNPSDNCIDTKQYDIKSLQWFFEDKGLMECEMGWTYAPASLKIIGTIHDKEIKS